MGVVCEGESKIPEFADLDKYQNIDIDHREKQPGASALVVGNNHRQSNIASNDADGHGPLSSMGSYVNEPVLSAQLSRRLNQLRIVQEKADPLIAVSNNRGREVHKPFLFTKKDVIYEGEWRNHLPHGCGKMHYPNGSLFEGQFTEGVPTGQGRFIRPNGDYFEGLTKAGRANGKGIYVSDNVTYRGEFQDDKPHGLGQQTSETYNFEGTYERGAKKQGTLSFRGGRYVGKFSNDQPDGHGALTVADGTYTGEFCQGLKHGKGVYLWQDGASYRGNYKSGLKHGFGRYCAPFDAYIYEGEWQDGRQHGSGTCWFGNPQQELRGKWQAGILVLQLP